MSYKDKYAESIERQFYDLENRIISDIIRRIKKTGEITSTADWQINKLMQLGYSSDDIESIIKTATKRTWPEMFELYDKVIDWEYVRNKKIYEQINGAFIPYEENTYLQQLIGAAKVQTKNTLQNFTQTMGIVQQIGGQYTFFPLTDFWQKTLDGAIMDITTGAFDYNSVLKKTVATLARSGIRTIDYASGYTSRLPVAARRAVMTGVSQMTGKIADYNAEQLGTEYFEVAWHANARPSHREWQGKVWSKDELVSVCGLGTVMGLLGANCYHTYYPFIPGVSERNWTDDELAELNAKEDVKKPFAGKEYNAYEATQRQRQLETAMRAQRTKVKGLEAGGADQNDIIIAKARYQGQLAEYKKFSDAMGLKPHMERVYIDGLGRVVQGQSKMLARSIKRKSVNQGVFSGLEIPMQKRAVKQLARKYGIDLTGITLKIQRSEALLALPICGATDYDNIGRIDLFPNAFVNERELMHTLLHEMCHVKQLRKYGKMYAQENLSYMEKTARRYECLWYNYYKRRK